VSTVASRSLRIVFTTEDLARLRVSGPNPVWETVLSHHVLQTRRAGQVFDPWRRETLRRLGSRPTAVSAPGVFAADDGAAQDFEDYHRIAIAPYWPVLMAAVELERVRLAGLLLDGGPALLLENLAPGVDWHGPVLAIRNAVDRELPLGGRGLLLVPSYFCWPDPVTLIGPALPPVLVYPLSHRPALADPPERRPGGDRTLAKLIGPTRAAVLRTLERPCTTTDLSRRAGTSVTSASQHASVLRRAGLVTTRRTGGAVRHSLTPLGAALLRIQHDRQAR
jgi:DNA-binding transcriptional ArsR family regulator